MSAHAPEDAERTAPAAIDDVELPRPDYAAAAPSDWMGARAVEVMLEDVSFPATAGELRARTGKWRVPVTGNHLVPMERLLDAFPENKRFRSAHDVAHRVAQRFKGF